MKIGPNHVLLRTRAMKNLIARAPEGYRYPVESE
jgi:hypothetical protein